MPRVLTTSSVRRGRFFLWDHASSTLSERTDLNPTSGTGFESIKFAPDGSRAAVLSRSNNVTTVRFHDATGAMVGTQTMATTLQSAWEAATQAVAACGGSVAGASFTMPQGVDTAVRTNPHQPREHRAPRLERVNGPEGLHEALVVGVLQALEVLHRRVGPDDVLAADAPDLVLDRKSVV